jgi:DNA-binding NarL/FixJ family response regulator
MRRLKLLIAEDHPLMVEAIRVAASADRGFDVVGAVESGPEVVEAALVLDPDLILLDVRLPHVDGIAALDALRAAGVRAKCVVLSATETPAIVELALQAGAAAFITKRIDPHDLAAALRQAFDQTLFQPLQINPLIRNSAPGVAALTEREATILSCVAEGLSNKDIARRLSYAEQTVKVDLTRVYRKLGVTSRTEAMTVALRLGLIERDAVVETASAG